MMEKVCGSSLRKGDRITHLPEPIRYKIISLLPMEDAIRTSILSREWRYITASLPNLDFDQDVFDERGYDEHQFRNIVDLLLICRDRVDVETFRLSLHSDDLAALHINLWILFAIRNNVRELHLCLWRRDIFNLPSRFFQCPTLTDLCLIGELHLKVPPDAVFPRLKSCELMSITFDDDTFTGKLFCSCPSIEELTLSSCFIELDKNAFSISSPSLKILTLLHTTCSTEISIHAKSLQKINCWDTRQPIMSFETLCSLWRVSFVSVIPTKHPDCDGNSILFGLRNVVSLTLGGFDFECMSRHPNSLESLASCSSLRRLELEMSPLGRHVNVVLTLLKIYNNVVTLTLRISLESDFKYAFTVIPNDDQIRPDRFMLEHLNTVEIENFGGSKEELHIARYVLENANVLEKMNIKYSRAQENLATMMVKEELLNITMASGVARLSFD